MRQPELKRLMKDDPPEFAPTVANATSPAYIGGVSIQEICAEVEALPVDERRRLAALLVSLRHRDLVDYSARMARKIDDDSPENWVTLEEMDSRLTT